jgi:hypothetical protein
MLDIPTKVQQEQTPYRPPAPIVPENHSQAWEDAHKKQKEPKVEKVRQPPLVLDTKPQPAQVPTSELPKKRGKGRAKGQKDEAPRKVRYNSIGGAGSQSKVLMRMLEVFTKDMLAITKSGGIKKKLLNEMTKEGADPDFVKWFAKEIMGLAKKYFDVTATEMKISAMVEGNKNGNGPVGGQTNIFIIKGLHDTSAIDITPIVEEAQQQVKDAKFEAIGLGDSQ